MKDKGMKIFGIAALIVLVAAMSILFMNKQGGAITSSTVGYWSLNGNTIDGTILANNGNAVGVVYTPEYKGQAGYFKNAIVTVPNIQAYNAMTNSFTVEAIVKPTETSHGYVVHKFHAFLLQFYNSNEGNVSAPVQNKFQFGLYTYHVNGSNLYYVWEGNKATSGPMVLGQTYYVAATYDGANLKLYVNGALKSTQAYSAAALGGTLNFDSNPISIGNNAVAMSGVAGVMGRPFIGNIQNVEITNRAKTATEISGTYTDLNSPALVCTPTAKDCASATIYRTCNIAGTAWVNTSCPSQTACTAGNCVSTCVKKTCSQLSKNCGTIIECGQEIACGTCTTDKICSSGVCITHPQYSCKAYEEYTEPTAAATNGKCELSFDKLFTGIGMKTYLRDHVTGLIIVLALIALATLGGIAMYKKRK